VDADQLARAEAARGFMPADEGYALYEAAQGVPDGGSPMLEIGSYCGKSAVYLGTGARERHTVLFALDHHRGSEENQPGWEWHEPDLVDPHVGRIDTLPRFRRTIHDADLESSVDSEVAADLEPDELSDDAPAPDADRPAARDADATTEVEPLIDDLVVEAVPSAGPAASAVDPDLDFGDPLPFSDEEAKPPAKVSPRSRPIPDPFPWGTDQPVREDLEATRLVADPAAGARYILQFSTGESVTVAGSGLVGRNPSMQPGEYVDQLVPIFDAGKSVSKTHLEFGQEAGRFWVSDRYSTNGSVIRQPDAEPRRCDAGRRYFVARGTRVDIGEQFFVVS